MSSSESTIVTLKGPDDWDAWEKQFKAEATRRSLLEHVEGTKTFLTAPMLPVSRNFQMKVQTGSSSVTPGSTVSISDLSADGRTHFRLALSFYKAQKDLYDGERDALDKLQTWMTKTVASSYAQTCFDYSEGIKEWYDKLKEQVSMNEHTIKEIQYTGKPLEPFRNLQRTSKLGSQIGNKSWPKVLTGTSLLLRKLMNGLMTSSTL